jgi:hypothetical protein
MTDIASEWIIGVVFGVWILYAFAQIFGGLVRRFTWHEFAIDMRGLFIISAVLAVDAVYVVATNFISKELISSIRIARVFWVLLMLLPIAVYAMIANKFTMPGIRKKKQKDNSEQKE